MRKREEMTGEAVHFGVGQNINVKGCEVIK